MKTKKTIILYDNWCSNCRKFAQICQKLDWFKCLSFRELRNDFTQKTFTSLNTELATKQMASLEKGVWQYGFASIYRIFLKIPAFWIFVPLFFVLKFTGLGQFLYQQLAIHRKIIPLHCNQKECFFEKK